MEEKNIRIICQECYDALSETDRVGLICDAVIRRKREMIDEIDANGDQNSQFGEIERDQNNHSVKIGGDQDNNSAKIIGNQNNYSAEIGGDQNNYFAKIGGKILLYRLKYGDAKMQKLLDDFSDSCSNSGDATLENLIAFARK